MFKRASSKKSKSGESADKEKSVPSKYKAVRTEGFRSTLESKVNKILIEANVDYCYECEKVVLIPKFSYNNKNYRELAYIPDFIVKIDDVTYAVEIKGFETPEFKLKWKLLAFHLMTTKASYSDYKFIIIKNLKELKQFLNAPEQYTKI